MATVLKRAIGTIISAIKYCCFHYRDTHKIKTFNNFNYNINMPKGRPLSLQVRFLTSFVFWGISLASAFAMMLLLFLLFSTNHDMNSFSHHSNLHDMTLYVFLIPDEKQVKLLSLLLFVALLSLIIAWSSYYMGFAIQIMFQSFISSKDHVISWNMRRIHLSMFCPWATKRKD